MMNKIRTGLLLAALLPLAACVDNNGGGSTAVTAENFDFVGMLANYTDTIIVPNYDTFAQQSADFNADTGTLAQYCNAIGSADESSTRSAAQAAWRDAMSQWQLTELHQLGPVLQNSGALRNRIHSYSRSALVSTCGIDQSVVIADSDANFSVSNRASNQRGLGAIEYLLFNNNLSHTCPDQVSQTSDWNSRPENERKQLRCNYARRLAGDVAQAADSLASAWETNGGNYRSTFVNPGNLNDSLKALSDALFYLDTETKDSKLGIPTGINSGCSQRTCPTVVESRFAQTSLDNIRRNLQSFITLLKGGDGLGFDDVIEQAGVPEVTDKLLADSQLALAEIDAMTTSLSEQLNSINDDASKEACIAAAGNPDSARTVPVCNLYGYIRRITDTLKVGFVAAVDVDLPDRAQSDND